jgi:glycosyltransferase involved in cell wall biosynthesis
VKPIISIIVPFYNPGEALRRCLDSLLCQTMDEIEVILVNDGSSDASVKISRQYRDAHPNVILEEGPNRGVSAARNRGLELARGEFIYFCDADDYVAPTLCEYLHSRMISSKAQLATCALVKGRNLDQVVCNVSASRDEIWDASQVIHRWYLPLQRGSRFARENVKGYLPCCLFRRDTIEQEQIRFTTDLSMNEDEVFLMEYLIHVQKAILSDRVLYYYCYSDNSLCANYFIHHRVLHEEKAKAIVLRSAKILKIFEQSGLSPYYPSIQTELLLNLSYHRVEEIVFSSKLRLREKSVHVSKMIGELRQTSAWSELRWHTKNLPRKKMIFCYALRWGTLPTMMCCTLKMLTHKYFRNHIPIK